jgi:hypothetical protein
VNVIGFLYSLFQFFAIAAHLTRKKHLIPRPKGDYFDFAMDQVCISKPLAPFSLGIFSIVYPARQVMLERNKSKLQNQHGEAKYNLPKLPKILSCDY